MPSGMQSVSLANALRWLQARRNAASVSAALSWLSDAREITSILSLYKHYFPHHYRKSVSSNQGMAGITNVERDFYALVGKRLFPLPDPDEMCSEFEERCAYIPVTDYWAYPVDPYYYPELPWAMKAFYSLSYMLEDPYRIEAWSELYAEAGITAPVPQLPCQLNQALFERLCRREGKRFADVPLAIDAVGHATGNIWLDVGPEDWPDNYKWNVESMDDLRAQWREAQRIMKLTDSVIDWLGRLPSQFARIVALWNEACDV
jgi:hypothetical protein